MRRALLLLLPALSGCLLVSGVPTTASDVAGTYALEREDLESDQPLDLLWFEAMLFEVGPNADETGLVGMLTTALGSEASSLRQSPCEIVTQLGDSGPGTTGDLQWNVEDMTAHEAPLSSQDMILHTVVIDAAFDNATGELTWFAFEAELDDDSTGMPVDILAELLGTNTQACAHDEDLQCVVFHFWHEENLAPSEVISSIDRQGGWQDGACWEPENCSDDYDNDRDGLQDCEDADCSSDDACLSARR